MSKTWVCNNVCRNNCCGFVYLRIKEKDIPKFEKERVMPYYKYLEKKWIELRTSLEFIKKNKKKFIRIPKTVEYKLYYHQIMKRIFLYMKVRCSKALQNNRCAIYRTRPVICRVSPCIMEMSKPIMFPFGKTIREEKVFKVLGARPNETLKDINKRINPSILIDYKIWLNYKRLNEKTKA